MITGVPLLAQLATKVDKLNTELAATEALGLLLQDAGAAKIFTQIMRSVVPELPADLTYSTQAADADGRPDLIGRDVQRECLHVEGKYWAGLTPAQSDGAYLRRMQRQHLTFAANHRHVGALLFVVPPRRTAVLRGELAHLFQLGPWNEVAGMEVAMTGDRISIALSTWQAVLGPLTASTDTALGEDARQLLGLVEQTDSRGYVPWTVEERTDQQTPRRLLRLALVVQAVHDQLLRAGVAEGHGRRKTITQGGPLAFGKRMRLGGVVCTLRLSLDYWAAHGQTPLWLSFGGGASAARVALADFVTVDGGVAAPVPLPTGAPEGDTVSELVSWLTAAADRLRQASGSLPPSAPTSVLDKEDDEDSP